MADIVFVQESHRYFIDAEEYPSVTRVLEERGLKPPYNGNPWYGERGRVVHLIIQLYLGSFLDLNSVDRELRGFFDAYVRFMEEQRFLPELVETVVFSQRLRIAGRLDQGGFLYSKRCSAIIDIKTGELARWMGYQLALYRLCLPEKFAGQRDNWDEQIRRFALRLLPDGTYKLREFADDEDYTLVTNEVERFHTTTNKEA